MFKKLVVAFTILALAVIAGTVPPKSATFKVTLGIPAVVQGANLAAGEYKLVVTDNKVTFTKDGQSQEVAAKIETDNQKHPENQIRYDTIGGRNLIKEIYLGGSKTRLIFSN